MFVAKALEYTLRRVVLLTVNRSVLLQNTVDDIREGASFGRFGGWRRRYPGSPLQCHLVALALILTAGIAIGFRGLIPVSYEITFIIHG